MKIKIQAQNLCAGDIMCGSRENVITRPQIGLRTPKGKVEVCLENSNNGNIRKAIWGKYTFVNIERN